MNEDKDDDTTDFIIRFVFCKQEHVCSAPHPSSPAVSQTQTKLNQPPENKLCQIA